MFRFTYQVGNKEFNVGNFAEARDMEMILLTGDDRNGTADCLFLLGMLRIVSAPRRAQRPPCMCAHKHHCRRDGLFAAATLDSVCNTFGARLLESVGAQPQSTW